MYGLSLFYGFKLATLLGLTIQLFFIFLLYKILSLFFKE